MGWAARWVSPPKGRPDRQPAEFGQRPQPKCPGRLLSIAVSDRAQTIAVGRVCKACTGATGAGFLGGPQAGPSTGLAAAPTAHRPGAEASEGQPGSTARGRRRRLSVAYLRTNTDARAPSWPTGTEPSVAGASALRSVPDPTARWRRGEPFPPRGRRRDRARHRLGTLGGSWQLPRHAPAAAPGPRDSTVQARLVLREPQQGEQYASPSAWAPCSHEEALLTR